MATPLVTGPWVGFGSDGSGKRGAPLTSRESEVYALVLAGKSNKKIATALGISARTVKFHVANLLQKCGAMNRIDLLIQRGKLTPAIGTKSRSLAPLGTTRAMMTQAMGQ